MKTSDEAAQEYAESFEYNDYTIETEAAFKAGVEFVQRWIPVEEEPLPLAEKVLVALDDGSVETCVKYENFALIGHRFGWDRPKIVSWRPINFK